MTGCDHKHARIVFTNHQTCERQLICTGCDTVLSSVTFEMLALQRRDQRREEDLSQGQMP